MRRKVPRVAERFLVTGGDGCLGAWVTRLLLNEGAEVVVFDIGADDRRHRLVSAGAPLEFTRTRGDITDQTAVAEAMADADRVIHLAALQVPSCRANPIAGAAVNVLGTVNVFEAARVQGIDLVVHASSIAVYGSADDYATPVLEPDAPLKPRTLYGIYKVTGEQTAAIYGEDYGVGSVCLRPHTVFGPGRDLGLTSQPTAAIEHAVRSEPYRVNYNGMLDFQYAPDVARMLVAAARVAPDAARAAPTLNLRGHLISVQHFLERVRQVTGFDGLDCDDNPLPLPHAASSAGLEDLFGDIAPTPLDEAIASTAQTLSRHANDL